MHVRCGWPRVWLTGQRRACRVPARAGPRRKEPIGCFAKRPLIGWTSWSRTAGARRSAWRRTRSCWAREPKGADGIRSGEKESTRWLEGYQRVAELAEQLEETRLVYVGDRESDMLELMLQARESGHAADDLLRCQHNRALPEGGNLWAEVASSSVLGELRFVLPPTKTRKARAVRQQLRAKRVALSDRRGGQVQVTGHLSHRPRDQPARGRDADRMASADQPRGEGLRGRRRTRGSLALNPSATHLAHLQSLSRSRISRQP